MRVFLSILFLVPTLVFAQKTHKVKAKESIYSIARLYKVSPKELAEYNKLTLNSGLNIDQVIKIPGGKTAASTKAVANAAPVNNNAITAGNTEKTEQKKHIVAKGETLFQISKKYSVKIEELKKWNNLKSDGVVEGATLIVQQKKNTTPAGIKEIVVDEPISNQNDSALLSTVSKPIAKNVPVQPSLNTTTDYLPDSKPVVAKTNVRDFNGGFFLNEFNKQNKSVLNNETGRAAGFKSTSGWQDGKYYCLHNSAPAGSVLKITNNENQKSIYAKVLDVMPDIKQNEGLLIRISNAAADELGVTIEIFNVTIEY